VAGVVAIGELTDEAIAMLNGPWWNLLGHTDARIEGTTLYLRCPIGTAGAGRSRVGIAVDRQGHGTA